MIEGILECLKLSNYSSLIQEKEAELSSPAIKDANLIPQVVGLLNDAIDDLTLVKINNSERHEYIILCITYLFSPQYFIGTKLKNGVRPIVAEELGISPARVSNILSAAISHFVIYEKYRKTLSRIYDKIKDSI